MKIVEVVKVTKRTIRQTNTKTSPVTEVTVNKGDDNKKVLDIGMFTSTPVTDNGSGVTILGCPTSSPYVFVSEITLPPSFLRRIAKVISQMEWRPYFEEAAKRRRDWFEALRKVDGLMEGLEETALKSEKKFPQTQSEYLALFQAIRGLFLSLEYPRLSCFWLTPSIPRSLRSPTSSSL